VWPSTLSGVTGATSVTLFFALALRMETDLWPQNIGLDVCEVVSYVPPPGLLKGSVIQSVGTQPS